MGNLERPRIALLVETSREYGRQLLEGISLFSRTQVNWSLLHGEMMLDSQTPDWLASVRITGVIARVDNHTIDRLRSLGVPIVDVRCNRKFQGIPQVATDDEAVAKMAFEHLYDCGFRRFAYSGFRFASYSEARLREFRKLVQQHGCSLSVHESAGKPTSTLTDLEHAGIQELASLTQWIAELKRPTGIFVCNDIRGQQILNACQAVDLCIPDDLGVIGVDDDGTLCQLCEPPLSSVRPDAARVGYRAAEIMHELLCGLRPEQDTEFIPPTRVTERESTRVVVVEDEELARVCRFIRQAACDGINVHDIVEHSALSRRQLERRFQEHLGKTPHDLITEYQIARVKQLLAETAMPLQQISRRAGYSHKERLCAVFKRVTGQTPGQYRSENPLT
jgi:LacI family transcriptional regulator